MIGKIVRAIEASYGSLERPDWSFVSKRSWEDPYVDLVKKLAEIAGSIQETTDLNDDCGRCLFMTTGAESLTLRLSFVGNFACVHDVSGRFFSGSDLSSSWLGKELLQLLKSYDVELIDEKALRTEIMFGDERHTIYDVLFSSDGLIS